MKKTTHKIINIINVLCIIAAIPGSFVGWLVCLQKLTIFSANASEMAELFQLLPVNTKWMDLAYTVSLVALAISTVTVGTIWKMFRSGFTAFASVMCFCPIFLTIVMIVICLTIALMALAGPIVGGFMAPAIPIVICSANKSREWRRTDAR